MKYERSTRIAKYIKELKDKKQKIVYSEIAQLFGVSRERVRQIALKIKEQQQHYYFTCVCRFGHKWHTIGKYDTPQREDCPICHHPFISIIAKTPINTGG